MINKKVQLNFPANIPKRCLMLTLCPNCIKPTIKLSPFKQLWKCSEVGSVWKIVKNLQRLLGCFVKSQSWKEGHRRKSHAFDSEKGGRESLTFGVMRKYCEVFSLQAVFTTSSNTLLSLLGSIPWKMQHIRIVLNDKLIID